ncbi:MAG: HAD-IC family P-type ATPase, partial [Desulfosarcina sp.]|nr:HAD-IC family P-type ATPase [Desulfobacterales bacterium]
MGSNPAVNENARIIHELSRRIRVYCAALYDPALDSVYFEAVIGSIAGVLHVRINTRAACIIVSYDGNPATKKKILSFIENIPEEVYQPESSREQSTDLANVVSRAAAALLTPYIPKIFRAPASWILSLPILLEGMDKLITEGIKVEALDASAVGFSLLRKDFVTANSVVAMLVLCSYMEQLSEQKTTDLLTRLLSPQIEYVWVEKEGAEVKIEPGQLVIGDMVICGTGELVPVDGRVIEGDALANLSSITGESVPVHIKKGDEILSGSVLEEGRVKIEALQVGSETGMARISRFLENSLRYKSKSQTDSNKLADKLVPITFGLGIGLYLLTGDINQAASVLAVDYSCAIKLATPVAVKVAMYTAAREGVLLKGSEAMDSLARVDTLVFDKTGTLTKGILEVVDLVSFGEKTPDELLALAACAEEHYTHPVANAVVRAASMRKLDLPSTGQVDFIVAHGVSAYVGNERVLVGSRHFINDDEKIDCAKS